MSHDPEAVEAIRYALAAVADGSGQEETVADALRDWLTDRADVFADALAAAGYTVTLGDPVAAEREACAQLVGREASILEQHGDDVARFATAPTLRGCEAAIRNRGEADRD